MTRLLSTIAMDFRLQARYGFYSAATFVALVWIVLLRQLPESVLPVAIPFVIYEDLAIVGFYFIAGMVLFEKGERTLYALVVTPLRFVEYLMSKLGTLTLLAIVVSVVVTMAVVGVSYRPVMLILGTMLMSLISLLAGFITVAPFKSISDYLIPSQIYVLLVNIPLIDYFGWFESYMFYIIPTQGSLILLRGAFEDITAWQVVYAVIYQIFWIIALFPLARKAYERHIIGRSGS